jgi:cysteine synthase
LTARAKGYKPYLFIPDKIAPERLALLKALADKIEVMPTVSSDHPSFYQKVAKQRAEEIGCLFLHQHENPSNLKAHYRTTGPEIWRQTNGSITAFVASTGTGGTFAGISKFLKEKNDKVQCYIIEPPGCGVKVIRIDDRLEYQNKNTEEKATSGSSVSSTVSRTILLLSDIGRPWNSKNVLRHRTITI